MESPIRLTSSRVVHEGRLMRLRLDDVILPRGTADVYEYAEIKHGATTLAVEDNLEVWLVNEWKYAVGRRSLEAVSGGMSQGRSRKIPLIVNCGRRWVSPPRK
jgi:hypothetical protein